MGECHRRAWLVTASMVLVFGRPVAGQDVGGRLVVRGRTEDAVSREPIGGAQIIAADSSVSVMSDSLGIFAIPLPPAGPLAVYADQFGYQAQRFDLEPGTSEQVFVLLLEPAPLEIEGLTVVEEAALTVYTRRLEGRRLSHPGRAVTIDRSELERFAPGMVLDLVRARWPKIRVCADQLCVRGGVSTLRRANPVSGLLVCVDEWRSFSPVTELDALPLRSVARVEIFDSSIGSLAPPQVRVYTVQWMATQAGARRTRVLPLVMGC